MVEHSTSEKNVARLTLDGDDRALADLADGGHDDRLKARANELMALGVEGRRRHDRAAVDHEQMRLGATENATRMGELKACRGLGLHADGRLLGEAPVPVDAHEAITRCKG